MHLMKRKKLESIPVKKKERSRNNSMYTNLNLYFSCQFFLLAEVEKFLCCFKKKHTNFSTITS